MRRPSWKTLLAAAILSACGDSITDPPPSLASITVTLSATTLSVGQTAQASATLKDASGNGFVVQGDTVRWGSSNLAVATVSSRGLVTATGAGTATITASVAGKSGGATLTVSSTPPPPPAPVASITVALGQASIVPGQTALATATLKDAANNTLSGRVVTWSSSPVSIATVSATGVITGQTPGSAIVTATSEGISGTATIIVSPPPPPPVTSVTITIADSVLATNAQTSVTVVLRDGNGTLVTDRTAALSSSNTGVATVFSSGAVTGAGPGTAVITAAIDGKSASVGVRVFTVAIGTPAQLTLTTPPSASAQSGATFTQQPVIQVRDGAGNIVGQAGIVVTVSIGSGGGTLGGTTAATSNASGVATFTNLSITGTVGARTLFFSAPGLTAANSGTVTITPSAPTQLAILTQPSTSAPSGSAFLQQPVVQLRDASGNAVSQGGVTVTAAIASGSGTLGGTATATTNASGAASFTSLSITGAGTHTLQFTSPGLAAATSSSIGIGAAAATQLAITIQPSSTASSGVAFAQQPAVQLRDASNNPVSQAGVVVTANLASGSGALSGTQTATTNASGVATFTNLSITGSGAYTLSFVAPGLSSVASSSVTITAAAPNQLTITTQPSASAQSGVPFTQPPVIQLRDGSGNAVSTSGVVVTAAIASGGGTLGGTTTATTNASGVAAFTSLSITGTVGTRTLRFTAPSVTAVTSGNISITAGSATKLAVTTQPSTSAQSGVAFAQPPVLQLQDASSNAVSQSGVVVTAAIATGSGTLGGTTTATTNASGVATFSGLNITGSGSHTLTFTAAGVTAATSGTIAITGVPTNLFISTAPPSTATTNVAFAPQPAIQLRDASNAAVSQSGVVVTAAVASGTGALIGTTTATTSASGLATFTTLGINGTGAHTLNFTSPSLTTATSGTITVSAAAAGCSNEPAGYTRIQDQPWNVAPQKATGLTSMGWFNDDALDDFKLTIQSDPTAPFSPSNVIRGEFNAGDLGGSAPFSVRRPFGSGELFPKLYLCMYMMHDANFDNVNVTNAGSKFFWPAGDAPGSFGSDTYTSHDGAQMDFALFQQNRVNRQMGQNIGPAGKATMFPRRGQWVLYEMLFVMNTASGTANGEFHVWIDGVKTHQYTNVDYTITAARAWQSLRWEPTYGGGTKPVPKDQYQFIDHLRMSGAP